MKLIDLTRQKFVKLTVIAQAGKNKHGHIEWLCLCDCGKQTIVPGCCLKTGNTKSCGCLQREVVSKIMTTHGHNSKTGKSKVYQSWDDMTQRCGNPNRKQYKNYGGRGIRICQRWKKFTNFLKDMGEPPTRQYTLDRINNNGNYCKSNCRWATRKQQSQNRRNNIMITHNNKTQCLSAWSDELGINYKTLWYRLFKYGWSQTKAFNTPIRQDSRHGKTNNNTRH